MITHIDSLETLFSEIDADKHACSPSATRYPLRCIFLSNFHTLQRFVEHFASRTNLVQLSAHLPFEDGWLFAEDILNIVRSLQTDSVIVPLSEVLRFFQDSDFIAVMTSLFEIENAQSDQTKRIYVPLVGVQGRFESSFFQTFHRKDQWASIWSVQDEPQEKIHIYQLAYYTGYDSRITPPACTEIRSTTNWLDLWKQEHLQTVICRSESMSVLYQHFLPDAIFHPERITNQKVYLEKIIGLHLPMPFSESETALWDTLIQEESEHKHDMPIVDFAHVMKVHFNIHNAATLAPERLLSLWFQYTDEFSRWLLKHWVLTQKALQNSYLFHVMSSLSGFSDDELIEHVWFRIFDKSSPQNVFYAERKSFLHQLHHEHTLPYHQLEKEISEHLASLNEKPVKDYFPLISNISFAERRWIVKALQQANSEERSRIYDASLECYPEFYHYLHWQIDLQNHNMIDDWLLSYFAEYTRSKALHQKTAELDALLHEKNGDAQSFYEWYYKLEQVPLPENAYLLWFDGVGAEWLPLLEYLINRDGKRKNKYVKAKYLTKAHLPTVTSCNRFENARHVLEFDSYIHNQENPYRHPDTLIKQIELLTELVQKHIIENTAEEIVVVSDHGCTFLAQKHFGNFKKYNFQDSDHEGRCMWTDHDYRNDADFFLHLPENDKGNGKRALIALQHTSFYTTPSREVHGGATPEEVVVPYLIISKIDERIIYHLELLTPSISVKKPILEFCITPEPPQEPVLRWKGKRIPLEKHENKWRVELQGYRAETYHCELSVMNQSFDLGFRIQGGFQERELL